MSSSKNKGKGLAIGLGILQIFIGIGAVPAGIAMITDPGGSSLEMPVEILINSPFSDFFIPGIFLLVVNGIGSLLGGVASFLRYRFAGEIAVGLGAFLIIWIIAQVWWMGIHWLHFLYIIFGIVELGLGLMLRKNLRITN
ncbi:MAG: hypothetical protein GXO75_10155 [Calditrichaeota bacterium]|nr:hypothetical protein [Calditrichota bacterium]